MTVCCHFLNESVVPAKAGAGAKRRQAKLIQYQCGVESLRFTGMTNNVNISDVSNFNDFVAFKKAKPCN